MPSVPAGGLCTARPGGAPHGVRLLRSVPSLSTCCVPGGGGAQASRARGPALPRKCTQRTRGQAGPPAPEGALPLPPLLCAQCGTAPGVPCSFSLARLCKLCPACPSLHRPLPTPSCPSGSGPHTWGGPGSPRGFSLAPAPACALPCARLVPVGPRWWACLCGCCLEGRLVGTRAGLGLSEPLCEALVPWGRRNMSPETASTPGCGVWGVGCGVRGTRPRLPPGGGGGGWGGGGGGHPSGWAGRSLGHTVAPREAVRGWQTHGQAEQVHPVATVLLYPCVR